MILSENKLLFSYGIKENDTIELNYPRASLYIKTLTGKIIKIDDANWMIQ